MEIADPLHGMQSSPLQLKNPLRRSSIFHKTVFNIFEIGRFTSWWMVMISAMERAARTEYIALAEQQYGCKLPWYLRTLVHWGTPITGINFPEGIRYLYANIHFFLASNINWCSHDSYRQDVEFPAIRATTGSLLPYQFSTHYLRWWIPIFVLSARAPNFSGLQVLHFSLSGFALLLRLRWGSSSCNLNGTGLEL